MADQNPADYPIGTNAFPAFERNVENLDTAIVDRGSEKFTDRKGVQRYTYHGIEQRADRLLTGQDQQFDSFMVSSEGEFSGFMFQSREEFQRFLESSGYSGGDRPYAPGITLNSHNEGFVRCEPDNTACLFYTPRGDTPLPYTTTGDWGLESDLFVVRGDDSLRQDLATSSKGASLVALPEVGLVSDALTYFTPEMVGAVGDFDADDSDAIEAILAIAKGRDIRLGSGKKYKISRPIQYSGDVSLVGEGIGASIASDSQDFNLLKISGSLFSTTSLSSSVEINSHFWAVSDVSGVKPGMLMEVVSSKSWYFDPRPESTDARKSELHKVAAIIGNEVITVRCANDGYDTAEETVSVSFYSPIKFRASNVSVGAKHELGKAVIGLSVEYADTPVLEDCSFIDASSIGIQFRGCYSSSFLRGLIKGTNGDGAAYALKVLGCTDTLVDGTRFEENYAGVDVSGFKVISLDTTVINTTVTGGGFNNSGNQMGWTATGGLGAYQRGHGSHGPADNVEFRDNTISKVHVAFPCRGRNIRLINNKMMGRFRNAAIQLLHGYNAEVIGNSCDPSFFGGKSTQTNGANIHSRLAENFIEIYGTFITPAGSSVLIANNKAIVTNDFVKIRDGGDRRMVLQGNTIQFRPQSSPTPCHVIGSDLASRLVESSLSFSSMPTSGSALTPKKLLGENVDTLNLEIRGWSEIFQPSVLGTTRWADPVVGPAKITTNGRFVDVSLSVSGGTVSATTGQDYSVTVSLPFKANAVGAGFCEGSATRWGEVGSVSGSPSNGGAAIGLRRSESSGQPVRAFFRYELV